MTIERISFSGKRLSDKLLVFYIRNIPDHPFKIRIVNFLNDTLFKNSVRLINKDTAQLQLSTREFIGHEIIYSNIYEPITLELCGRILKKGGNFIDIGANIGLYSISLSKLPDVSTYAIEPSAHNFTNLLNNIKINGLSNIQAINVALSFQDSFGYLVNPLSSNSGTNKVEKSRVDDQSYLIRLAMLKDVVKEFSLPAITLIKMDVEGYEMNILKGYFNKDTTVLPQNIVMEFSDMLESTGYSELDCYNYLINLGYKAFKVTGEEYSFGDKLPESNIWFSTTNHAAPVV